MQSETITFGSPVEPFAPVSTSKRNAIVAYRIANPNATAKQIAAALGANIQYVYNVLKQEKKGPKTKRKPGRPAKVTAPFDVPPVKRDPEMDRMRNAVSEHARIVDGLRKEIEELTVIIAYLEHRVAKAERHRGLTV
jgi:sugar-specific transcriptional regulator TrmB